MAGLGPAIDDTGAVAIPQRTAGAGMRTNVSPQPSPTTSASASTCSVYRATGLSSK